MLLKDICHPVLTLIILYLRSRKGKTWNSTSDNRKKKNFELVLSKFNLLGTVLNITRQYSSLNPQYSK